MCLRSVLVGSDQMLWQGEYKPLRTKPFRYLLEFYCYCFVIYNTMLQILRLIKNNNRAMSLQHKKAYFLDFHRTEELCLTCGPQMYGWVTAAVRDHQSRLDRIYGNLEKKNPTDWYSSVNLISNFKKLLKSWAFITRNILKHINMLIALIFIEMETNLASKVWYIFAVNCLLWRTQLWWSTSFRPF